MPRRITNLRGTAQNIMVLDKIGVSCVEDDGVADQDRRGRRDGSGGDEAGVVEKGAYADRLLITGNPLEDISVLAKPEEKPVPIMKDGIIYNNDC